MAIKIKGYGIFIHRLEQWDLNDYVPFIFDHWHTPDSCKRIFYI